MRASARPRSAMTAASRCCGARPRSRKCCVSRAKTEAPPATCHGGAKATPFAPGSSEAEAFSAESDAGARRPPPRGGAAGGLAADREAARAEHRARRAGARHGGPRPRRRLRGVSGIFPEIYRATVAAGEQAGHLDKVLERLADYTES